MLGQWRSRAAVGRPLGWLCVNMTMRKRSDGFRWYTKGPLPLRPSQAPSITRLGVAKCPRSGVDNPWSDSASSQIQTPKRRGLAGVHVKRTSERAVPTADLVDHLSGDMTPWTDPPLRPGQQG
ncbi:hypothetical protein JDV02_008424 [Purpureocillium takamizusanense]|uniref:Uncharacterized protein n=1 Tax=Purpureocillium takamizusanense TaxID=2060973 RepID=A0A9Q8QPS0_9HYPO|nr:uncharacterized protein JDV02_008424 [Purpureocillium takamizusanense]UNI22544.1 hypothetical protein JDV02_008424 [Purpureocillium takamizusanense]